MAHIGLVVEGRADVTMSDLVRRYLAEQGYTGLQVASAIRANDRGQLLKEGQLEKLVHLAATREGAVAVLVIFDADKELACEVGPEALARVQGRHSLPVKMCMAVRNVENWIVASAETTLSQPPLEGDPDGAGAIQAIKQARKPRAYRKPAHMPGLLQKISFDLARGRSPSFARFLRIIDDVVEGHV